MPGPDRRLMLCRACSEAQTHTPEERLVVDEWREKQQDAVRAIGHRVLAGTRCFRDFSLSLSLPSFLCLSLSVSVCLSVCLSVSVSLSLPPLSLPLLLLLLSLSLPLSPSGLFFLFFSLFFYIPFLGAIDVRRMRF